MFQNSNLPRTPVIFLVTTMAAGSAITFAQAQSNSPFARTSKKAWEQTTTSQTYTPPRTQVPTTAPSQVPPYQTPSYSVPNTQTPTYPTTQSYPAPSSGTAQGQSSYSASQPRTYSGSPYAPTSSSASAPKTYPAQGNPTYQSPQYQHSTGSSYGGGQYYPQQSPNPQAVPVQPGQYQGGQYPSAQYPNGQYQGQYQGGQYQGPYQNGPYPPQGQNAPDLRGPAKPSWSHRLGWDNINFDISGRIGGGMAAVDGVSDDYEFNYIGDFDTRAELSAMTPGGLEYGAGVQVRAQHDNGRNGFGGLVGDCPVDVDGCNSVEVDGVLRPVKGFTGQFYTAGNPDIEDNKLALEGAYLFLRSSYGDVIFGKDDGAAYLFSLGAPSLMLVSASNSSVDYTGLDSVRTQNDASGNSAKIAYTTPRLLGDQIGFGVQMGVSYAFDTDDCGVDFCVEENTDDPLDAFGPQIEDVIELGFALDRKFANGFEAELTGTYAQGSEETGNAAFEDLKSYGIGMELKYADIVFGTSYLHSNNAFAGDGNYKAYDVGLTWQPSQWGFSASYGYAKDKVAEMKANQAMMGVSYDFDTHYGDFRLGSGLQYVKRKAPVVTADIVNEQSNDSLALFIEASMKF